MGATSKHCKAGFDHAALKSSPTAFAALKYVGRQVTEADAYGPREVLELRDCACTSTLSMDVTEREMQVAA